MVLIVGLGNPGKQYENNRHNVGYMFLDHIAKLLNCSIVNSNKTMKQFNNEEFKLDKTFESELLMLKTDSDTIVLAKPQTFMNRSGKPVKKIKDFYKVPLDSLFVAHDDLDIPLGKFHIQKSVGPKLHNGISSIEEYIGAKEFWRIRIGIENRSPEDRLPGEAYVLQNFTEEEKTHIYKTVFPKVFASLCVCSTVFNRVS